MISLKPDWWYIIHDKRVKYGSLEKRHCEAVIRDDLAPPDSSVLQGRDLARIDGDTHYDEGTGQLIDLHEYMQISMEERTCGINPEQCRIATLGMRCGCGEAMHHYHQGAPCCGGSMCCPSVNE